MNNTLLRKSLSLFLVSLFFATNISFAQETTDSKINWPAAYEPGKSKFYVHNEILINAKPETIWNHLVDALKWELWYDGATNVRFVAQGDSLLNLGKRFSWTTMGQHFTSTVKEYEPYRLLAWESAKKSIQGYHVWMIIPVAGGYKVITDESQNGWLVFLEKTFQRNKLKKLHDVWLSELKKKAEASR